MTRREFPAKVRLAAWDRSGGNCEDCGIKIITGQGPEYDHDLPDDLGGEPTLENCVVRCIPCHRVKTREEDIPRITKARRLRKKAANATARKAILPGSKASKWRKRMDGTVERRS